MKAETAKYNITKRLHREIKKERDRKENTRLKRKKFSLMFATFQLFAMRCQATENKPSQAKSGQVRRVSRVNLC